MNTSLIGTVIDNYRLTSLLGEGGMSAVYLGTAIEGTPSVVAIKVLLDDHISNDDICQRFNKEAIALEQLKKQPHPNIVKIISYGIYDNKRQYIIMEYVEGVLLDHFVSQHHNNLPLLILVFTRILDALSFAHSKGIIHRDLKPSNIIVRTKDQQPILLDFGIARLDSMAAIDKTKTGSQIGTLAYMSPEQVLVESIDHRTDIYSIGIILWEAFAKHKWTIHEVSDFTIRQSIIYNPLPVLPTLTNLGVQGQTLQDIIHKATEKKRELRYTDCTAFKDALVESSKIVYTADKKQQANKVVKKSNVPSAHWIEIVFWITAAIASNMAVMKTLVNY